MSAEAKKPNVKPLKKKKAAPKKDRNSYQQGKLIAAQAYELITYIKYNGAKNLSKVLKAFEESTWRQTIRKAIHEATDPAIKLELEGLGSEFFPGGLSTRPASAAPPRLKVMTSKQRKKPFVVVRLPDEFGAVRGDHVARKVQKVGGKLAVVLTMEEK